MASRKITTSENDRGVPLAKKLAALLKLKNVSASQIAHTLGLPLMTIRRLVSGETTDPRISTIKMLANYFKVPIDQLMDGKVEDILEIKQSSIIKPHFVPIFNWSTIETSPSVKAIDISRWTSWQPLSVSDNEPIGKYTFALESRPSMYPRFPNGTIFIFDPELIPRDGDLVLVKIRDTNELTLRELKIDPPEWQLQGIVPGTKTLPYILRDLEIIAVNLLTLLFNRR